MWSLLRTATQAYMVNREGLVYARGYMKLTEMMQRLWDAPGWACGFSFLPQPWVASIQEGVLYVPNAETMKL